MDAFIQYYNIIAGHGSLRAILENANINQEHLALEVMLIYALNCDKTFETWERVSDCPRLSSAGVYVLGASVIGYRRKVIELYNQRRIMLYAPIRELPKYVFIDFAESLVTNLLFDIVSIDWVGGQPLPKIECSDPITFGVVSQGDGQYRTIIEAHDGNPTEYRSMCQPLCDFEKNSDAGSRFIRLHRPHANAVKRILESGVTHANDRLWLSARGTEFAPNLNDLFRMDHTRVYPSDSYKDLYADLIKLSMEFNESLNVQFGLSRFEYRSYYSEPSFVRSIRYGPLIFSETEGARLITKQCYRDMSLYQTTFVDVHTETSDDVWEYDQSDYSDYTTINNIRRRAHGIASQIAVTEGYDTAMARIANEPEMFYPADAYMRNAANFDLAASLSIGAEYVMQNSFPVRDHIEHTIAMRIYVDSLAMLAGLKRPWWSHDYYDCEDIAIRFNLEVDHINRMLFDIVQSTLTPGVQTPRLAYSIMIQLCGCKYEECSEVNYDTRPYLNAVKPLMVAYNN